jgi:hypothetical protein
MVRGFCWLLVMLAISNAMTPQSARAGMREGRAAMDRGDHPAAIREFTPLAASGNPEAQRRLGLVYAYTLGPESGANAVRWLSAAAEKGDRDAMQILARFSERALGMPQNLALAEHWYSAEGNLEDAARVRRALRALSIQSSATSRWEYITSNTKQEMISIDATSIRPVNDYLGAGTDQIELWVKSTDQTGQTMCTSLWLLNCTGDVATVAVHYGVDEKERKDFDLTGQFPSGGARQIASRIMPDSIAEGVQGRVCGTPASSEPPASRKDNPLRPAPPFVAVPPQPR